MPFLSSLYQETPPFLVSSMALASILGHHFDLKVKTDPKYNEYHSIRSAKPELVEKNHFIGLSNTSGSREITVYVFKYGVGAHFWAAILDLNVKMVSERSKNLSNRLGMVQEISLLMVFNMA